MAQITLRGIDASMENEIRELARKSGKSLSRVVLDMIDAHTGHHRAGKTPSADSLRELAGGWTEKEASEFLKSIRSSEQIDEEMW